MCIRFLSSLSLPCFLVSTPHNRNGLDILPLRTCPSQSATSHRSFFAPPFLSPSRCPSSGIYIDLILYFSHLFLSFVTPRFLKVPIAFLYYSFFSWLSLLPLLHSGCNMVGMIDPWTRNGKFVAKPSSDDSPVYHGNRRRREDSYRCTRFYVEN